MSRPHYAVLSVSDTGVGIEADLLPRVVDLFVQADRSLDRSGGGLGVGLALVQQLVRMHGGSVEVVSVALGRRVNSPSGFPRLRRRSWPRPRAA